MALAPIHKYFVFNEEIQPNHLFVPAENEGGIYEVLRVEKGIPLFLEDHLDRFKKSAKLAGHNLRFSEKQIEGLLMELINNNEVKDGNILISCKINLKAFFINHSYPTEEMYRNGVVCGTLEAERENPNAKVFQTTVRQQANQMIEENGFYEVLLVDHLERITEGSRSNVFFIRNDEIYTPPGNIVLHGITRAITLEISNKMGVKITEKDIFMNELQTFQAAFITGTSPKILPVKIVGKSDFDPDNLILRKLMDNFEIWTKDYISKRQ